VGLSSLVSFDASFSQLAIDAGPPRKPIRVQEQPLAGH